MKGLVALFIITLAASSQAFAGESQYRMRVDGLACPYCAYGIEKNLKKIDGVEEIEVDLNNGLVIVNVAEGVALTDEQMSKLFNDSGFTFRSMSIVPPDAQKAL